MKTALILYDSGLGDCLQLTPQLKNLHNQGYTIDMMVRKEVKTSLLLDHCKYIRNLIEVLNPWDGDYNTLVEKNLNEFLIMSLDYDWSGYRPHDQSQTNKTKRNDELLGLKTENMKLEVYISEEAEMIAQEYIKSTYSDGFIFTHTDIEYHEIHNWNCSEWIKDNLPDLPVHNIKTKLWEDINISFVIMREATHRILSSSVYAHASDAMGCTVDVMNYGNNDGKMYWLDESNILNKRVCGQWLKKQ